MNLTYARLDFIHRFIRLWKKSKWSIPELDLVLLAIRGAGLIATDFTEDAGAPIRHLAELVDIQEKLNLTVEELCPLIDELPVSRQFPTLPASRNERRLYERLFDLQKLFGRGIDRPTSSTLRRCFITIR